MKSAVVKLAAITTQRCNCDTTPTKWRTTVKLGNYILSTAIMTHPARIDMAREIAAKHPELRARVVLDPQPDGVGNLTAAAHAWMAIEDGATHQLVLQDDTLLSTAFEDIVATAIEAYPRDALALCVFANSGTAAHLRMAALAGAGISDVRDPYFPTVAAVLPVGTARDFARLALTYGNHWRREDDIVLGQYLMWRGIRRLAVLPNPVEHVDAPSLVGNDWQGIRRSICFADSVGSSRLDTTLAEPDWVSGIDRFEKGVRQAYRGHRMFPSRVSVTPWKYATGMAVFEQLNLDVEQCGRLLASQVRTCNSAQQKPLPPEDLDAIWTAAFALGADLAHAPVRGYTPGGEAVDTLPPFDTVEKLASRLVDPCVRECLATFSMGALTAAAASLHPDSEALLVLVKSALETGFEMMLFNDAPRPEPAWTTLNELPLNAPPR